MSRFAVELLCKVRYVLRLLLRLLAVSASSAPACKARYMFGCCCCLLASPCLGCFGSLPKEARQAKRGETQQAAATSQARVYMSVPPRKTACYSYDWQGCLGSTVRRNSRSRVLAGSCHSTAEAASLSAGGRDQATLLKNMLGNLLWFAGTMVGLKNQGRCLSQGSGQTYRST